MHLRSGLAEEVLLSRIFRFHQICNRSERGLGYYLLDFDRRGLYQKHGCAGTVQFAFLKLQLPAKRTRELLRMARALEELRVIEQAWTSGRISWSAVRELTRVATKETEKEWVELAEKSSIRKIEHAVSRTKRGEAPCRDAYALAGIRFKVTADLSPEDYSIWETAFARMASTTDGDLDATSVLMALAQFYLEQPLSNEEQERRNPYQVVYHRCTDCENAWLQTVDGPEGIAASKVEQREPMAEVFHIDDDAGIRDGAGTKGDLGARVDVGIRSDVSTRHDVGTRGDSGTRHDTGTRHNTGTRSDSDKGSDSSGMNDLYVPHVGHRLQDWEDGWSSHPGTPRVPMALRDIPNPFKLRHQVLMRDGYICAAPGCVNKAGLNAHHAVWRSHGGKTQTMNLLSLCRSCHSLVHTGFLEIVSGEGKNEAQGIFPLGNFKWLDGSGKSLGAQLDSAQRVKSGYPAVSLLNYG